MSNLNVRLLDLPTHSRQFDANCGKIRYVSDPLSKIFVVGFRMQVKTCFRTSGADLKQKLDLKPDAVIQSTKVAQIILYYHVTKKFLPCLNWLVTWFRLQNMFWKRINCFRFWWKTYTKHYTSNYVISRVKILSFPALCGWSGAFNFRIWFGKRKNVV